MLTFRDFVGVDIAPVSKKPAVKVKVMGLNPDYFLKSFLIQALLSIHVKKYVLIFRVLEKNHLWETIDKA